MGLIETLCKQRADLEGENHIEHEEWLALIDEMYGELFGVVAGVAERYFEASETLTTDGTNVLAEPEDLQSVVDLWYVSPTGSRSRVRHLPSHKRGRYNTTAT